MVFLLQYADIHTLSTISYKSRERCRQVAVRRWFFSFAAAPALTQGERLFGEKSSQRGKEMMSHCLQSTLRVASKYLVRIEWSKSFSFEWVDSPSFKGLHVASSLRRGLQCHEEQWYVHAAASIIGILRCFVASAKTCVSYWHS